MTLPIDPVAKAAYEAYWLSHAKARPFGKLTPDGRRAWSRVVRAVLTAAKAHPQVHIPEEKELV